MFRSVQSQIPSSLSKRPSSIWIHKNPTQFNSRSIVHRKGFIPQHKSFTTTSSKFSHLKQNSLLVPNKFNNTSLFLSCITPLKQRRLYSNYENNNKDKKQQNDDSTEEKQEKDDQKENKGQEELRDTTNKGPVGWREAIIIITLMIAIVYVVLRTYQETQEKAELEEKKLSSIGRPDLGGPFELYDTKGRLVTDKDFRGKWMFIYFGFTNCPDICPTELDKMTKALNTVEKYVGSELVPIFISVDPDRDTPEVIERYLKDFHSSFIGLTGPKDKIKDVTREFRVYYTEPTEEQLQSDDYLVDHSIIMYLMDPEGNFAEYYTNRHSAQDIAYSLIKNIKGEVV